MNSFINLIGNQLVLLIPILLAVAILTLLERKVLGYMQFRKGPNVVGARGILQPFADGMKLFMKESIKPSFSASFLFLLCPPLFFNLAIVLWVVVPMNSSLLNINLSLLFILAISSLSIYGILWAGWASNSKYALLGAVRAGAQVISYEVSLLLILFPLVLASGGWALSDFQGVPLVLLCLPLFLMWFITTLAETNRTPFDLAEGESELVSGYNVEYSGAPFALFFIGEYANIIIINVVTSILFFNWNLLILIGASLSLVFTFLWIRASLPRFRFDQLMDITWKGFLPLSMGLLLWFFFNFAIFNLSSPFY
uniref:NADH-ubiquinone oxidoreductase chain 1 n=1 Tax=Aspidophiura sp. TaxID=3135528 RepID=A0AAU6QD82_9ECHI